MKPSLRALLPVAALALSGCATSANVVSASSAPGIRQAQAEPYDGPKQRIAVSAFEYRAGRGDRGIGEGLTDMLTTALFNSGRFIVLEREQLDEVVAEQDLAKTGRFRKETVARTGELEGAQLLVRGSVIQFEPECSGGSAILVSGQQACLAINLRIIDARTGRVVNATTVEGTSARNRVGLLYTGGSLPLGLGAFSKTPMEAALRDCIETAVQHIVDTKL